MKATIEFDLPEENDEFELFTKARDYYCALSDIDNVCRSTMKYGEDVSDDMEKLCERIRYLIPELP